MKKKERSLIGVVKTNTPIALYKVFRLVILICLSYIVLYPVLTMLVQSITLSDDLYNSSHLWIPDNPTFTNYTKVLEHFPYWKHLIITLEIVAVCTVSQMVVCSLVGYGLARYKFPGNAIIFIAVLSTIIVPVQTAQIPMYNTYRHFDFMGLSGLLSSLFGTPAEVNLISTNWVYYLPSMLGVGLNSGLFIFLFRQFFKGLPRDLEEAAWVDGCGAFRTFLRIIVPSTVPVFVTVGLLSSVFYWNDTLIGRMFMGYGERMPLMLYVEAYRDPHGEYPLLRQEPAQFRVETYVILVMTIAPLILLYIIGQRFFNECLDRSGIKG